MSRELADDLLTLALQSFQAGSPTALVVRHAERGPIEDLLRHEEVLLTEAGVAAARRSGQRLGTSLSSTTTPAVVRLVHSPVERCQQTAAALAEGLVDVGVDAALVGARPPLGASYLRDQVGLKEAFAIHGKGFLRAWFNGEVPEETIAPAAEVVRDVVDVVRAVCAPADNAPLVIAVTHDWNIAAIREQTLGLRYEDAGWPAFLDGVVCRVSDAPVFASPPPLKDAARVPAWR